MYVNVPRLTPSPHAYPGSVLSCERGVKVFQRLSEPQNGSETERLSCVTFFVVL